MPIDFTLAINFSPMEILIINQALDNIHRPVVLPPEAMEQFLELRKRMHTAQKTAAQHLSRAATQAEVPQPNAADADPGAAAAE